jgi:hypothetical protein
MTSSTLNFMNADDICCAFFAVHCSWVQEFSDWAQCQVLELVAQYTPASDAEVGGQQQQQKVGWLG